MYCFGVDIGGTTIKMGLFQEDGTIIDKWEIETRTENGGEEILPDIAASIEAKMVEHKIPKEELMKYLGIRYEYDKKSNENDK